MNAPVRTFTAAPAVRETVPLLIGLCSPSGGGKTFSALRLATGIQSVVGGDIYVIDTENRRALHYADKFSFKHVPFTPPFGSLDYLTAIRFCASKKPAVTIIDSMSHEHVGEGGYLETAEAVVTRIAGDDYGKRQQAQFAGYAKAGPIRTQMIEGIKQLGGNFIFCWRAKEKVKPMRVDGKVKPVELGLMPIGGEEWIYEMAVNCMLPARAEGVPQWRADHIGEKLMMKLPEYFKPVFAEQKPLDEDTGRKLAEWAQGKPSEQQVADNGADWRAHCVNAATEGTGALQTAWGSVPKEMRAAIRAEVFGPLKEAALEADKAKAAKPADEGDVF